MKRTFTAVALAAIVLISVITVSFAYSVLINSPKHKSPLDTSTSEAFDSSSPYVSPNQESNSTTSFPSQPTTSSSNFSSASQSTSPAASAPSSPALTQAPEPTYAPDSAYPEGMRDWLPWGSFGMFSPANQTYTTNNLILNVTGGVISGDAYLPILSYSLDGGQRVPVPITLTKPEMLALTFQRVISGSIPLPPLLNGSHILVLFGDLGFDSRRGKIIIYFEVQAE